MDNNNRLHIRNKFKPKDNYEKNKERVKREMYKGTQGKREKINSRIKKKHKKIKRRNRKKKKRKRRNSISNNIKIHINGRYRIKQFRFINK